MASEKAWEKLLAAVTPAHAAKMRGMWLANNKAIATAWEGVTWRSVEIIAKEKKMSRTEFDKMHAAVRGRNHDTITALPHGYKPSGVPVWQCKRTYRVVGPVPVETAFAHYQLARRAGSVIKVKVGPRGGVQRAVYTPAAASYDEFPFGFATEQKNVVYYIATEDATAARYPDERATAHEVERAGLPLRDDE